MTADVVERLWALSERHTPGRVLVWVRDSITARWLTSLLSERGATVGVRVLDTESLLRAAMIELAGEPLPPGQVLAEVHAALLDVPGTPAGTPGPFAAIAEHPSYQREVLRCFVELERAGLAARDAIPHEGLVAETRSTPSPAAFRLRAPAEHPDARSRDGLREVNAEGRDALMLAAFERFVVRMQHRAWWRGQAPARVIEGHRQVSFLRRRAAAVALGFAAQSSSAWELGLIDALGFERWDVSSRPHAAERQRVDLTASCAGPEAEIAEVARLLRAEPERPAIVLAPSDSIARWVARLRHRDVPVRAWVEHRAANTGAAGIVRALLRVLAEPQAARRRDVEALLFGPALRAWASVAETLGIDYPRCPHPGDLRTAWEGQRASSFSLAGLAGRLSVAADSAVELLVERAGRLGWSAELLEQRSMRTRAAHRMLARAIERLDQLASTPDAGELRALLDDWDLLGRAAVHSVVGPELTAARIIIDLCTRMSERDEPLQPSSFALALDHALAGASTGNWAQSRALSGGGGPPVWVVPYASVGALGRLPARLFLTGLDAHPHPPVHHGSISDALRRELGLAIDTERFELELRELDELVVRAHEARATVVASWRHRDGAGAQRPPGPWIAGRQDDTRERAVGVDVIALPSPSPTGEITTTAPLERALIEWASEPELRRRVEAMRAHEAPTIGPHTGELGVRVPASVPYSASALQRYAELPYRYFVERVIGLREREPTQTAASLLASEQGQAVHRALEAAHVARLGTGNEMLELATQTEPLLTEVLTALSEGYRKRAEHGQAEAIWANERDRWATELTAWWQHWQQRLREGYGSSTQTGRPEPEARVPGLFLLAAEWSPPGADDQPFELDLGLRRIPFVAAIDRIEFDPLRRRIDVVDYKTGRPLYASALAAQLRAGVHLQLPLYALAVQQVVSRSPQLLRLQTPAPVAALRLEYLQRPLPRGGGKPSKPEARGFAPTQPLGLDTDGRTWSIIEAAASFTIAFVSAIEAGRFPVVAREPRRGHMVRRIDELMRVIPPAEQRQTWLPPALLPFPDAQLAREVVQ